MTEVSVIITSYNDRPLLERCLRSIKSSGNFEVIIVDDTPNPQLIPDVVYITPQTANVSDEPAPYLDDKGARWVKPSEIKDKYGYIMAREIGARKATGDYIVFCDTDVVVPITWWLIFKSIFNTDPRVQAIGPRIFPAWHQWVQTLPKELQASSPDTLDALDMTKLQPETWDLDNIPDMPDITKGWRLDQVTNWNFLNDCFVCLTRSMTDTLRKDNGGAGLGIIHYPGAFLQISLAHKMRQVVSNRVAVWHGK